jgi:hypothetical protein
VAAPELTLTVLGLKAESDPRSFPDLNGFAVEVLARLLDGRIVVCAIDHRGWPVDAAIFSKGIEAINRHGDPPARQRDLIREPVQAQRRD